MAAPPAQRVAPRSDAYRWFCPITTRWMDNDVYGHINNVAYYSFFDSAANLYLIREAGLDIERSPEIALVVASSCEYHAALAYPDALRAGVRIDRLGEKSVTWAIAIFAEHATEAAASGTFVHVFVDRTTRKSAPIPHPLRVALEKLTAEGRVG